MPGRKKKPGYKWPGFFIVSIFTPPLHKTSELTAPSCSRFNVVVFYVPSLIICNC